MKLLWQIVIVVVLFVLIVLLVAFFIQRPLVQIGLNGKVVLTARRSLLRPIRNGSSVNFYSGSNKVFSLWEDYWDGPVFVYPFADCRRFLCDYDDDTSMLDFIVDFRPSATNGLNAQEWPLDAYARNHMASRMTNVVFETKGVVRLPSVSELQEVSDYLTRSTSNSVRAGYFNYFVGKELLLLDLATNRSSLWPTGK